MVCSWCWHGVLFCWTCMPGWQLLCSVWVERVYRGVPCNHLLGAGVYAPVVLVHASSYYIALLEVGIIHISCILHWLLLEFQLRRTTVISCGYGPFLHLIYFLWQSWLFCEVFHEITVILFFLNVTKEWFVQSVCWHSSQHSCLQSLFYSTITHMECVGLIELGASLCWTF